MEERYRILIKDLHIEPQKDTQTYLCQNFKIFPEEKEENGGYLFGIIELKATPVAEAKIIINLIINTLKDSYYQQIISSPTPNKLNIETIFEFALNKTNQKIIELIQIGQITLIKENLSYFIGLVKPQNKIIHIYFTNHGQINAYLLHNSKKNTQHLINVIEPTPIKTPINEKLKIFSAITAGQISTNDIFFVCTEQFNTFISPAKIKQILLKTPVVEALNYFRSLIKNIDYKTTFAHSVLVIKNENNENKTEIKAQKSIDEFISNTERTEKLLTSNLTLNFGAKIKNLFKRRSKIKKSIDQSSIRYYLWLIIKFIPLTIFSLFKVVYLIITGRKKISWNQIKETVTTSNNNKFPIASVVILLIIIICIGILLFSLHWLKEKTEAKKIATEYENQLKSIKDLIIEAESSLIYNNKNQSLAKLQEAQKEIETLPKKNNAQLSNYNDLNRQISELKNKIFNIEKAVPQLINELTLDGQPIQVNQLIFHNNYIYSFGDNPGLYRINLTDKKIDALIPSITTLYDVTVYDNKLYFISKDKQFFELINDQLIKQSGSFTELPDDIAMFNGNFYFLYKNNQQISKLPATIDGFGTAVNWIKDRQNVELNLATSIVIDGSIYILNTNGQITKFYAGVKEEYTMPKIEPKILNARKIISDTDWPNLYILDVSTKRIIIVTKTGTLIKQLLFDSLPQITDFTISTDAKRIYLLSDNKIYQFNL